MKRGASSTGGPRWVPHLTLFWYPVAGQYWWRVFWRDAYTPEVLYLYDHKAVPFMVRKSQRAIEAHAFAARLNQQRGGAY